MSPLSVPVLGFLESIGTSELLVLLVVALVVFGPRKLPEMGRTLGRSLNEFKRASEEFQRTWEHESDAERAGGGSPAAAMTPGRDDAEQPVGTTDAASLGAAAQAAGVAT